MRRCTDYFAGDFAAISALRAAAGAAVALRNAPAGAVRAATYFAHGGKVGKTPPGPTPLIKGRCPEGTEGIGTGSR